MVLRADCTFGQTMQYAEPIREHALSGILRATIWRYSNQLSKFEIKNEFIVQVKIIIYLNRKFC